VRYDAATQTEHYGVHAYFATTGTRFSWSFTTKVGADIEVTHSERAIYVTEFNGQTPTVLRARLR
jgi:hypothetical protein